MAVQSGFWIITGWVSRSELYENGTQIKNLPVQSDMVNGRSWVRPDNTADVVRPAKIIDTPVGSRFATGGYVFSFPLRAMSPNMVKYVQDTYFSPTGSPSNFYYKRYYNKLTVQTFNRATGEYEAYQVYGKFPDVGDATPALGGYDPLQIDFVAYSLAPDGPDMDVSTSYPANVYDNLPFDITFSATNVGDSDTFDDVVFNHQIPAELNLNTTVTSSGSVGYSTDGITYSGTHPMDLTTVTNVRVTFSGSTYSNGDSTGITTMEMIAPSTGSFTSTITVSTTGDTNAANDSDVQSKTINTFVPSAIDNLNLWLDGNSDVYTDGGSNVTATNTDTVDEWRDQSTFNYDFTQVTLAERPTYSVGSLNSQNGVVFDGIDNWMLSTVLSTSAGEHNVFIVANPTNSNLVTGSEFIISNANLLVLAHKGDTGSFDQSAIFTSATWFEFDNAQSGGQMLHFRWLNENTYLRRNGTDIASFTSNASVTNQNFNGNSGLGAIHTGASDYFDGIIYEIIVYNSALTTAERNRIDTYLLTKYNL